MTPEVTADNPTDLPKSAPSTSGLTTKVVKGSLWTLAGQITPLAVSLITTPFVIRMLGAEGYGVLALVGVITAYLGFADFGMSIASTKFASEAFGEGDLEKEARIVRTAALISLCSSVPVALILFGFSSAIISFFNVPEVFRGEAALALKLAAITFVINFLNAIFNTPQLTRLRMDLNTMVTAGFRILGLAATPFAVYLAGVVGAVSALLLASLLTLAGHLYISRRVLPELFGRSIDRNAIPPLFKFGLGLIGSSTVALMLANIDKGILPRMVSVQSLAYYTIGFTLAGMMLTFASSMNQSLIPAFSQLQRDGVREEFQRLYTRGIKLTILWLIPCMVLLSLVANPFFIFWAGEEFAQESVPLFFIFLAGLAVNIPSCLPYAAVLASGRTKLLAHLYLGELIPYVALVIIFTHLWGAVGTAVAWSIKAVAETFILFYFVRRDIGISYAEVPYIKFVPAAMVMLTPLWASYYFAPPDLFRVVLFLICFLIYFGFIWSFALNSDEKHWAVNQLARFTD